MLSLVWPLPRSLATTDRISVDFSSSPYLDVSVRAVPPVYLCIQYTVTGLLPAGFPHSEIHGLMPVYGYPWHIAVNCVLLRLPVPRHSPCALCSLTIMIRLSCIFAYSSRDWIHMRFLPTLINGFLSFTKIFVFSSSFVLFSMCFFPDSSIRIQKSTVN